MTQQTFTRRLAIDTDAALALLDGEFGKLSSRYQAGLNTARNMAGERPERVTRSGRFYASTAEQAIENLRSAIAAGTVTRGYYGDQATDTLAKIEELDAKITANREAAEKLEAVHEAHGWSRFFTVQDGHIHRDHSAWNCNRQASTEHGWNPELSGLTEAEAVAALGPSLCTKCFPSAPVEWTVGKPKADRCAGSGKGAAPGTARRVGMRVFGTCAGCGTEQSVNTSSYRVRAHKPTSK